MRSWYQRKAKDQLQVRKNGTKESNKQQTKMLTRNQPTFWPLNVPRAQNSWFLILNFYIDDCQPTPSSRK